MLLDNKSKKLLRILVKQQNKNGNVFTLTTISKFTPMSQTDIEECINFLIDKSLVECNEEDFGFGYVYKLTKSGKIYFEINRKELIRSILTPLAVSIIATLITIFIKDFLLKFL